MKAKYFAVLILLVACLTDAYTQWLPNPYTSGNIYFNGGNVGIGTSGPSQKLDVIGRVKLRSDNSATSGLWFTGVDGNQLAFLGQLGTTSNDPLGIWHGGAWRMTMTANGDMGLGTISPVAKVDVDIVNTDASRPAISIRNSSPSQNWSGALSFKSSATTAPFYIYTWDNELQFSHRNPDGSWKSHFMIFKNETGNVLFTNTTGSIGIGTNNPVAKVQIHGNGVGSTALSIIENSMSGAGAHFVSEGANNIKFQLRRTADNVVNTELQTGGNSFINAVSGNVGIGTTSPDAKLAVNGTIHSKEVKVDLSVPGPDYVFEEDYALQSLEEIESYVKQNKHLPDVPSAMEMEEEGIKVGEMNMVLLKKIEELTLHVIELKKEIELLKTDNK